ncbi:MAG: hypothetical protein HY721_31450 [Planctomycetes bacterium]|nr:hypothetical protein [Planctomycetota bacterium]
MKRRSFDAPSTGLTLLEVVISAAILASATLAAAILLVPIASQARLRREVQAANAAAKVVLEKIQAVPFNEIVVEYPQGKTVPIPDLPSGSLSVSYVDPTADPLLVQVDLSWDSAEGGTFQRTFNTVRTE